MATPRVCSIPDCGNVHKARGLCRMHYKRMLKNADMHTPARVSMTKPGEPQRFYQEVVLQYEGEECLIWPYGRSRDGYGTMKKDGKSCTVSRITCQEDNGNPPTSKHVAAHSCGNGHLGCVSKRHLSWKTPIENSADSIIHGTSCSGERTRAKLTELQAREILSSKGSLSLTKAAEMFGVSRNVVCSIRTGRTWAWL